jgi:excisionase family DNA binding protein
MSACDPTAGSKLETITPLCVDAAGVAALLGVSLRTVRRLAECGKLPAPIAIGGCRRWLVEDIHRWLRSGAPGRR